ncbi:carotenoid oxygenase family protein [Pantanalinema sp. GBBB05]|uniref:carotenoid oxygenase family protein n=1 Tax=Pantanalinema sp. GBBB05 TaxID=2604139 RepID=UPI001D66E12C|nr:carotenoid oxygenase family protein [Pantanalinema sp. GBBB05]
MQTQAQPIATSAQPSYTREDWQKGYRSLSQELDYWIDDIEGEIPAGLQGTLFRNGPGLLDINGQSLQHPFDGDGMICAIAFQNGRAHFRNRFVQTEGYLAEQAAGKILYRGVFGTDKPGGWFANLLDFKLKNIANTNVIYWGGKLLALWEAAEPHRLDPDTLDTIGLDYLDGLLQPGSAFGAHPWVDPDCDQDDAPCLVNFSIKTGLSSTINLYEFNPSGRLVRQYAHTVPGFAFIHDFAITRHHCIFFQNPVQFNPLPYFAGLRTAGECIRFLPEQPTKIIVIPRQQAGSAASQNAGEAAIAKVFETMAGFVFHHINAFEEGDDVVIDSICYQSLPAVEPDADFRQTNFEALDPGQVWRFRVNLQTGEISKQLLESRCCEFPAIHPAKVGRPYRYFYIGAADAPAGNAPLQAILKVDLETGQRLIWSAAPRGFMSEPIFVPRSPDSTQVIGAEDDGWLLALVFDAAHDRSDLVILDARDLTCVARLHLKHHVPYGLHGSFTPEVFGVK